ncbi:MAG: hypothetical protein H5T45_04125 [Thermoplasmatales archaeon]|nr:hypothetical protein [Thermoplasmatales archaeon]
MRIVHVKCPKCKNLFFSKKTDMAFICENCGALHIREDEIKIFDYEFWRFSKNMEGEKYYMPFWKMDISIDIRESKVVGIMKIANLFKDKSGRTSIYIPGIDLPPEEFRHWSNLLTFNPPNFEIEKSTKIERIPLAIGEKEAEKLADFLILTYEAEKPGVLQYIDYEMKINERKIVYVPVYLSNNKYVIGV